MQFSRQNGRGSASLKIPVSLSILAGILFCLYGCQSKEIKTKAEYLGFVKDSVILMTTHITSDLARIGPIAWLNYFENSPDFFMAVDGKVTFTNYQTAKNFISDTLTKSFQKINLHWESLRIVPLAFNLASMGAYFHEDLLDPTGKTVTATGYLTATAAQTGQGWKLRNVHWSTDRTQINP
jgi:hypothetical protein